MAPNKKDTHQYTQKHTKDILKKARERKFDRSLQISRNKRRGGAVPCVREEGSSVTCFLLELFFFSLRPKFHEGLRF
jgi:hypothetical protein